EAGERGEHGGEHGGHATGRSVMNPATHSHGALAWLNMRFDREQLETLAAVVDAGTFDAAATRLRVTPSAVSQRIKAFERELGRVLVVRSKPVQPTASGDALVRLARQLTLLERDAVAALGGEADSVGTRVVIPVAVNAD